MPVPPPEPSRLPWREASLIGLIALTLNLVGNGRVDLWDRDEPRYVVCTREMRASGDWVRPTFNGVPRYQKPVLIYWLMLAGTAIGGDNPFGARLVSAFAGLGTCLLVWRLGRGMLGPRAGRLAGLIMATAPIVVIESKLATIDAALAFALLGCWSCLWELSRRPSRLAAAGFWIGLAAAVLLKGPVGPAFLALAGLASWWWGGPSACWGRLRWRWGVPAFVLLTAPWYVAIGVRTHGEFFREALGKQVVHRVATGIEQHGAFPGYYPITSLLAFHPWSALVPAALYGAWARRKSRPEFGFLLGWAVGPLILLECVQTKLLHYYLPCYGACALLVAWLVDAVAADASGIRRWPLGRLATGLLGGVAVLLTVALTAGAVVSGGPIVPGHLRGPCLALAAVIGGGTLYALERLARGRTERGAVALGATWAVALALAYAWLLPAADHLRISRRVGERLASLSASEGARPMLATYQQPGVIYALGRPAPAMRSRDSLRARLRDEGPVLSALFDWELRRLGGDPGMRLDVLESIRGFNMDKGQRETLYMTVIRAAEPGSTLAGPVEDLDVE